MELSNIKNCEEIYIRTLSKLLTVEKKAMYGSKSTGKSAQIEKILLEELNQYRSIKCS